MKVGAMTVSTAAMLLLFLHAALLGRVAVASLGSTALEATEEVRRIGGGKLLNYTVTANTASWEKTVIIVTGGRMGSTVVAGLVNCGIEPGCSQKGDKLANPDVFIGGENYLPLWYLFEFDEALNKGYAQHLANAGPNNRGGVKNPWYHTPNPVILAEQMQMMVQTYFLQDMTSARIVGFKEVRWYQRSETRPTKKKPQPVHSAENLQKFILWIHKFVPNLHVIFHLRNPEDTSKSGWWRGMPHSLETVTELHDEILTVYTGIRALPSDKRPKVFMLDYDQDILKQNVSKLYHFLGERFNEKLVDQVFTSKYSSSSQHKTFSNIDAHAT